MKNPSRSKKGITTTPFFITFSAFILLATAAIAFTALAGMQDSINEGKTLKETIKLAEAINEIHSMGDPGSVETVRISLPTGYYIKVQKGHLEANRPKGKYLDPNERLIRKFMLDREINDHTINKRLGGVWSTNDMEGMITCDDSHPVATVLIVYWPKSQESLLTDHSAQIIIYEED